MRDAGVLSVFAVLVKGAYKVCIWRKKSSSTIKCNSSSRKKILAPVHVYEFVKSHKIWSRDGFNADVWNTVKCIQMFNQLPHRDDSVMTKMLNTTLFAFADFGGWQLHSSQTVAAKAIWGCSKNFTLGAPKVPEPDERMGESVRIWSKSQKRERAWPHFNYTGAR